MRQDLLTQSYKKSRFKILEHTFLFFSSFKLKQLKGMSF